MEKFFQRSKTFCFCHLSKKSNYYVENLKSIIIDLLSTNIGFANTEAKFLCKVWLYYIDLVTKIDENFN